MKIGEALAEKKSLQTRLAKCYQLLQNSYYYYEKPDFNYQNLRNEIDTIIEKLKDIKLCIMHTNITKEIQVKDKSMSLAEIIIEIGDIRSKIGALDRLYRDPDDIFSRFGEEQKTKKPQVEPEKIRKEISDLTKQLTEYDSLLQHYNWTIDVVEI